MAVSADKEHWNKIKTLPDSHREVPQHKHKIKHDKTTMHHLLYTFVYGPFNIFSYFARVSDVQIRTPYCVLCSLNIFIHLLFQTIGMDKSLFSSSH